MKTTPKDFFMHLLGFGALYASAVSLMSLWFSYINIKFPDPLNSHYYSNGYEQLRVPMAILIVVFPVFILIARWISKHIVHDPSRKELFVYKWLVYLTLFVSAVTVIISFITIIYQFLGGELTISFGLKALDILLVTLAVFGYYLWHLRTDLATTTKKRNLFAWLSIVVILVSIIFAFFVVGSPSTARAQKFDQQRVNDLQNISWQIQAEYQQTSKLPINPEILSVDPQTNAPYEYKIMGPESYQLCATFAHESQSNIDWSHPAGYKCFTLDIASIPFGKPTLIR